jgi:hypothetical protein
MQLRLITYRGRYASDDRFDEEPCTEPPGSTPSRNTLLSPPNIEVEVNTLVPVPA